MSILYEGKDWRGTSFRITTTALEHGSMTYPLRSISTFSPPFRYDFEFTAFLVNIAAFIFGFWCISKFQIGWIIGGIIAAAIGGFNVWTMFHREYRAHKIIRRKTSST